MIIIGAGLSGLLAATQFQQAEVFEAGPATQPGHRALLRFRSSAVGDAVGIEFRKVLVHKGIWDGRAFVAPDLRSANAYSLKVLNRLGDRSVWNIAPVERFIAPDDLMDQLRDRIGTRIQYNSAYVIDKGADVRGTGLPHTANVPLVWTAPMSTLVEQLALKSHPAFDFLPIHVLRMGVKGSDVFQTVYFPSEATRVYRASITGGTMIIESMAEITPDDIGLVLEAFGLTDGGDHLENWCEPTEQRYGKIAPIDDAWRRKFIVEATQRLNVYSLGRFATWRNVLADDVLKDIGVIKRLLKGDAYASSLKGA